MWSSLNDPTDPSVPGLQTPISAWFFHKCLGIKIGFHSYAESLYRLCHPLSSMSDFISKHSTSPSSSSQKTAAWSSNLWDYILAFSLGFLSPQALQIIFGCTLSTLRNLQSPLFPMVTATPGSQLYELPPGTQRVLACSFPDSPSLTKASFTPQPEPDLSTHGYSPTNLLHIQDASPSWDPQLGSLLNHL